MSYLLILGNFMKIFAWAFAITWASIEWLIQAGRGIDKWFESPDVAKRMAPKWLYFVIWLWLVGLVVGYGVAAYSS